MTEGPSELTVLLEVVHAVKLKISKSTDKQLSNDDRAQIVEIVNNFGPGSIFEHFMQSNSQGVGEVNMGDQYTAGQVGAQGPGAMAQHMTFNQVWNQLSSQVALPELAQELSVLRTAMQEKANETGHYSALAEVAQAQDAASEGDGPKAVSHLAKAGKWALGIATSIGTAVAATAIKSALGL